MALIDVKVPQLSESIAEATLLQWKKQPGQAVAVMNHGDQVASGRINQVLGFQGLDRVPVRLFFRERSGRRK